MPGDRGFWAKRYPHRGVGLRNQTSDAEIISFAEKGEWIVVSKDTDFFFSHLLFHQPKNFF
ncbi:MAG: hypothetical protein EBT75_10505 [Proteobacteria bacterium]|nr:hypothetical protein [Pseudomonadota bacterium]NBS07650.1 hypothetical protein [Verrucomicrobiota bacterium]NBS49683.1 hypothetical protein [Verrucomicrobiota bacterium]NBS80187.1 hypothetical protein [bacterium]